MCYSVNSPTRNPDEHSLMNYKKRRSSIVVHTETFFAWFPCAFVWANKTDGAVIFATRKVGDDAYPQRSNLKWSCKIFQLPYEYHLLAFESNIRAGFGANIYENDDRGIGMSRQDWYARTSHENRTKSTSLLW